MGSGDLEGWQADPFRRHEARYFSVGRPTELVRDGNAVSYDVPPSRGTRWRRGLLTVIGSALLATAAVAAVLVIVHRPQAAPTATLPPGISAAGLLPQSAQRTLAQRTARVTLSGSVQAHGSTIQLSGAGEADFSTSSLAIEAVVSLPTGPLTDKEVAYDGTVFYSVSVTGRTGSLPAGRSWVQMPARRSYSAGITSADPLVALHQLAAQGNTVRAIGTKTIGGVACDGYDVTPRSAPAQALTVWIDSQRLVREEDAAVQMTINGAVAAGNLIMNFTNFGAPVEIVPPPGSDIIAYGAVQNDVGLNSLANLLAPGNSGIGPTQPPTGTPVTGEIV